MPLRQLCYPQPQGGFVITKVPYCSALEDHGQGELERPASPAALAAINAIQATPWTINRWLFGVMQEAWSKGLRVGGLEVNEALPLPPAVDDAEWQGMSVGQRKEHVGRRKGIHEANASMEGRSTAVLDALAVAQELQDQAAIYYPHKTDWRGRIYPAATTGPNPQGSDIDKALLMFATGLPLGKDGLFWLCVRAANCWGEDKLPLADRVAWAFDHATAMMKAAASPLGPTYIDDGTEVWDYWWTHAAEPWQFLATCHELSMAFPMDNPEAFVSHLPIPMDGSCNGLQHLSAMALDPVGAKAVNMTADPRRHDIYATVADEVASRVSMDAAAGKATHGWLGNISRATVKRAVMTTPYGVTHRGIRDQLILDGHSPGQDYSTQGPAADYLKDLIVEAMATTAGEAKKVMAWLQNTATSLARAGLPFDWSTPIGSRVRQAYHVDTRERIDTLAGNLVLYRPLQQGGLNVRKQAAGAAPNFVHSFDAAHLGLTVLAAHQEGVRSFAMIHDSFGTHACHTTALASMLRQTFVHIYRTDWLLKTYSELRAAHPHVELETPPWRGDFDIAQVLDAPFFFS